MTPEGGSATTVQHAVVCCARLVVVGDGLTQVGSVLAGKYRVLAKLGEGGMGSVFRAENQVTGKAVALKCLHPHVLAHADSSERLLREARASSILNHPNVVDVYDILRDGETMFLVMELLEGRTLRSYLAQSPRPRLTDFLTLLLSAIAGVAAAHARGVIHRDLKPDNIFLARVADQHNTVVKVLDFGIAKLLESDSPTLTQTGVSLGTPFYMSLEQLRGDKKLDGRADVYAFGVMLYEAVTGSLPYEAESLPELAIKVATTDAAPVKSRRADIPTSLARLIDWAVARDRDQRLPDVRTLQRELEVFARNATFHDQMTAPAITLPRVAAGRKAIAEAAALMAATTASATRPLAVDRDAPPTASTELSVHERVVAAALRTARWALAAAAVLGLSAGAWLLTHRSAPVEGVGTADSASTVVTHMPLELSAAPAEPTNTSEPAAGLAEMPVEPARSEPTEPKPTPPKPSELPVRRSKLVKPRAAAVPVARSLDAPPSSSVKTSPNKKKSSLDLLGF